MARRRNQKNPVEALFGFLALVVFLAMINPAFRAKLISFSASLVAFVILVAIIGLAVYLVIQMRKTRDEPIKYHLRNPVPSNTIPQSSKLNSPIADRHFAFTPEPPQPINTTPQKWDDTVLKIIEWRRFEIVTKEFLRMSGFEATETKTGADGGVDIRISKTSNPESKGIVQCKAWNTYKVGIKVVRELFGVMAAERISMGMVITSGVFTGEAEEFAKGKITLVSGQKFLEYIKKLPEDKQQRLLNVALEGDYSIPTCPQCNVKMTLRESSKVRSTGNQFWGCINYPRCRQSLVYKKD